MSALDRTHCALKCTQVFQVLAAQHLNDSARARVDVVVHLIMAFLGSSIGALDHSSVRLIALPGSSIPLLISTLKPHFSVNDLQHNKTPKLTKTLENNKPKSLTNIS